MKFLQICKNKVKCFNALEMYIMKNSQSVLLKKADRCLSRAAVIAGIGGIFFAVSGNLFAAETTGGVSWVDPLNYTKPQFLPITVPNEASVSNKYYVDMTSGSGTTCSQSAPCKSISNVAGKPGTTGGPAYIYLKGQGRLSVTGTLYGSIDNEVVIKPWPGDSNPVVMTSLGSASWETSANIIKGSGVHHLIVDGGPNMQFEFRGSGPSRDQNNYTLVVSSNYVTLARSKIRALDGYGPALGVGTGSGSYNHIWFINNELYDSSHYYGVYTGGGTGCSSRDTSHSDVYFRNNIFRDICGRGIQIEPRNSANFTYIEGNAFHNVGYGSCIGQVSDAVQPADSCGASISNTYIRNNLMFDLGGGGVGLIGSFSNTYIQNNTIYDYAKSTPLSVSSHGISCYADGCKATVQNNIILHTNANGINPINRGSGFTTSSNLCESGKSCGSSSKTGTRSTVFESYDSSTSGFLKLKSGSSAIGGGASLFNSGITIDYLGLPRVSSGSFDVGAMAYTVGAPLILPPQNLR